ncbi:hypothetical protein K432DRAFT_377760 [Lepidopterella palustris CBS 459.81]|uniref:Uncharacterized protein n=1 Tax=Lepidopterella palustris CBS 459.81 TaxID=1314670 RepID=A0A8E2EJS2_9PEZI|nr:hypothetical protein K432DRAFT_377760 [Lepidopterella palustris CBS 459.81]
MSLHYVPCAPIAFPKKPITANPQSLSLLSTQILTTRRELVDYEYYHNSITNIKDAPAAACLDILKIAFGHGIKVLNPLHELFAQASAAVTPVRYVFAPHFFTNGEHLVACFYAVEDDDDGRVFVTPLSGEEAGVEELDVLRRIDCDVVREEQPDFHEQLFEELEGAYLDQIPPVPVLPGKAGVLKGDDEDGQ